MNLRTLPRAAVGGYIKLLRWPVDRVLGRNQSVDRAEAAARAAAGAVMGDGEMQQDAGRRHVAAKERERAEALREEASRRAEQADRELADRAQDAEQVRRAN